MFELRNPKAAVPVVLFAGLLWSFGPLVVRHMNDPHLIPWQYIFGRGLTVFIILNLYLFFEEGISFYKNYTVDVNKLIVAYRLHNHLEIQLGKDIFRSIRKINKSELDITLFNHLNLLVFNF